MVGWAAVAVALAAVAGVGWASGRLGAAGTPSPGPATAAPSVGPSFGTMYEVNPSAWASDSRCKEPATDYVRTQADYADAYLAEPSFVLSFTGAPERHVQELRRTVLPFCNVRVRIVTYSLAQLEDLRSQVAGDLEKLKPAGVSMTSYWIDVISNKVQISVMPGTLTPQVRFQLERRYPAGMISIDEQPPSEPV